MHKVMAILFLLVLTLAACAQPGTLEAPAVTAPPAESQPPTKTPSEAGGPEKITQLQPTLILTQTPEEIDMAQNPTPGAGLPMPENPFEAKLVLVAKSDLADRLGVTLDEIQLVNFELVTWSDAGLGCPQPGMAYIQIPVDGTLIELSVDGKIYRYHSGGNQEPFLCEQKIVKTKNSPAIDLLATISPDVQE